MNTLTYTGYLIYFVVVMWGTKVFTTVEFFSNVCKYRVCAWKCFSVDATKWTLITVIFNVQCALAKASMLSSWRSYPAFFKQICLCPGIFMKDVTAGATYFSTRNLPRNLEESRAIRCFGEFLTVMILAIHFWVRVVVYCRNFAVDMFLTWRCLGCFSDLWLNHLVFLSILNWSPLYSINTKVTFVIEFV